MVKYIVGKLLQKKKEKGRGAKLAGEIGNEDDKEGEETKTKAEATEAVALAEDEEQNSSVVGHD